jgi:hypothetical protein
MIIVGDDIKTNQGKEKKMGTTETARHISSPGLVRVSEVATTEQLVVLDERVET